MAAPPTSADPADHPDPSPDRPAAATDAPSRSARLLGVLRKLMDYGKELAGTLRRRNGVDLTAAIVFGTTELALILQRITLGLHRAAALEARVLRNAVRLDRSSPLRHAASPRAARPKPARPREETNPQLARLPTPEAIAAAVRRRPIGLVLEDICHDLGILPRHPLWHELQRAILYNGGNLARLALSVIRQKMPALDGLVDDSTQPPSIPSYHVAFAIGPASPMVARPAYGGARPPTIRSFAAALATHPP